MSRPVIVLRVLRGHWFADRVGDALTMRLFGTTELPTPFSASVPLEAVLARIASLNPSHDVRVSPSVRS